MNDQVPSEHDLIAAYMDGQNCMPSRQEEARSKATRALAKMRADAKVEALREAVAELSEAVDRIQSSGNPNPLAWQTGALAMRDQLRIRADSLDPGVPAEHSQS